jgi:hypothetical protein
MDFKEKCEKCYNFETIDTNSFVPIHIQQKLLNSGWKLTYSNLEKVPVSEVYPDGLLGRQDWELKENNDYELCISYLEDGKHDVVIWYGENDTETFKLRKIISVLNRRGLIR